MAKSKLNDVQVHNNTSFEFMYMDFIISLCDPTYNDNKYHTLAYANYFQTILEPVLNKYFGFRCGGRDLGMYIQKGISAASSNRKSTIKLYFDSIIHRIEDIKNSALGGHPKVVLDRELLERIHKLEYAEVLTTYNCNARDLKFLRKEVLDYIFKFMACRYLNRLYKKSYCNPDSIKSLKVYACCNFPTRFRVAYTYPILQECNYHVADVMIHNFYKYKEWAEAFLPYMHNGIDMFNDLFKLLFLIDVQTASGKLYRLVNPIHLDAFIFADHMQGPYEYCTLLKDNPLKDPMKLIIEMAFYHPELLTEAATSNEVQLVQLAYQF